LVDTGETFDNFGIFGKDVAAAVEVESSRGVVERGSVFA